MSWVGVEGKRGTTYADVFQMLKENKQQQREYEERKEGRLHLLWGDDLATGDISPRIVSCCLSH